MEIDRSSFYRKHKKHKATSQQKYRSLVQQRMEKISDSSQICFFLSIIVTNQSTNIEYYRVLSINRLRFR